MNYLTLPPMTPFIYGASNFTRQEYTWYCQRLGYLWATDPTSGLRLEFHDETLSWWYSGPGVEPTDTGCRRIKVAAKHTAYDLKELS